MTPKDRLRLLIEELSDDEAAGALAYVEAHHNGRPEPTEADRERAYERLLAEWAKVPPDVSLVDELIAERRAEARREAGG